jgi:hypothetical protein
MMSVLNLIAQLLAPDYPCLYMIRSEEMAEAEKRGGLFDGAVGMLRPDHLKGMRSEPVLPSQEAPIEKDPVSWKVVQKTGFGDVSSTPTCALEEHVLKIHHQVSSDNVSRVSSQKPKVDISTTPRTELVKTGMKVTVRWRNDPFQEQPQIYIPAYSRFLRRGDNNTSKITYERYRSYEWWRWDITKPDRNFSFTLSILAPVIFGALSLTTVGVLSHFSRGTKSTSIERGFTMSWLLVGMFIGVAAQGITDLFLRYADSIVRAIFGMMLVCITFGAFIVPALGGYIVVGKMIMEFGSCSRVD